MIAVVVLSGCSFDSSLSETQCSESLEGERLGDQVCRNGYWVQESQDSGAIDTDQPDVGFDTKPSPDIEQQDTAPVDPDTIDSDTVTPDANKDTDSGDPCAVDAGPPAEGCPCDYSGTSMGVCGEAAIENGSCIAPDDYAEFEDDSATDEADAGLCDGLDNDCDGSVDEGCPCLYDNNRQGVCRLATIANDGSGCREPDAYDASDNEQAAGLCDGLDNDCDGEVDEQCDCTNGETQNCGTQKTSGICQPGTQECIEGTWGECTGAVTPAMDGETCDESTRDEDCDGVVDEGCTCNYDGTSEGVCGQATRDDNGTCRRPESHTLQDDESAAGLCDGLDNDCDGVTDEGCPCSYDPGGGSTSEGVCSEGVTDASNGSCNQPTAYRSPEDGSANPGDCDDLDNDCDGVTDEGCACNYDGTTSGVCSEGTRQDDGSCQQPGEYISGDAEAEAGECDSLDNDCDGTVDEGCLCFYKGLTEGVCTGQTIQENGDCSTPSDYEVTESGECDNADGLDNDCDGFVDETGLEGGDSCGRDCECPSNFCSSGYTNTPRCAHRIFVTSESFAPANLAGIEGAHDECQRLADRAGRPGTWRAILSDANNDASSVVAVDAPILELDGSAVIGDPSNFWSNSHLEDINQTELRRDYVRSNPNVWTGTDTGGTHTGNSCNNWSSSSGNGTVGDSTSDASDWIDSTPPQRCTNSFRLYCIDGQDPHP